MWQNKEYKVYFQKRASSRQYREIYRTYFLIICFVAVVKASYFLLDNKIRSISFFFSVSLFEIQWQFALRWHFDRELTGEPLYPVFREASIQREVVNPRP